MPSISAPPPTSAKVFAGKTFVLQGNFGQYPRTHQNISRLIAQHGGYVEPKVTKRTTHVVTTLEEFKRRPPNIEKAIAMGKARCRIVQWEYIEDSVFTKSGKPRAISANFHEIQSVLRRQRRFAEAREIYTKKFVEEGNMSKALADPGLHHQYIDTTGFKYNITLTRRVQVDQKNRMERYTLTIFESHASPHTYTLGARFNRPGYPTSYIREFMVPSTFDIVFKNFKKLFKKKTGIDWDQRLDGLKPGDTEKAGSVEDGNKKETAGGGKMEEDDRQMFVYIPPLKGKPMGVMPLGCRDPKEIKAKEEKRAEAARKAREEADRKDSK